MCVFATRVSISSTIDVESIGRRTPGNYLGVCNPRAQVDRERKLEAGQTRKHRPRSQLVGENDEHMTSSIHSLGYGGL